MNRQYFWAVIGAAIICILLIIGFMWNEQTVTPPKPTPTIARPVSPFKSYIAAVGIAEPSSGNIEISTPLSRVVEKVFVEAGSQVKKGDVLFRLEDLDLEAQLFAKQVAYKSALVRLQKLEEMPRKEDLQSAEAAAKRAQAEMEQAQSQYQMVQGLQDTRALSQEAINNRKFGYDQAQARFEQAKANLEKVRAGTWKPDLDMARLDALQAKAAYEQIQAEIQRTIIKSPIDGIVLKVDIHPGELPPQGTPAMIVGNTNPMYLRVSINQFDTPYFQPGSPAEAFLQGNARVNFPLEFVRVEPYLEAKQNLIHDITQTIDTRVLHVLYQIKDPNAHVYVGQLMDVFIETQYKK